MKISARNQIPGKITELVNGAVNGEVKVDIGNGIIFSSSITEDAIIDLGLAVGDDVYVIVKASNVMIGK